MRIELVINALKGGGAQRQMVEMAILFDKYGHDVTLTTLNYTSDDYYVPNTIKRVRLGKESNRIMKWAKIFWHFQRVRKDAIIVFLENRQVIRFTFFHFLRKYTLIVGERGLQDPSHDIVKKKDLDLYYRFVDYVVPNSYAQRDLIVQYKPKLAGKVVTIQNYTDLSSFRKTPLPHNGVIRFGIFARYDEMKNPYRFLDMVSLLRSLSKCPFVFEWYGYNDTSVYKRMVEIVDKKSLQDFVKLNERISNVEEKMMSIDCVFLPSLVEGFPNVLAEAICCGRPCLASDVSDNATMVRNNVNGFLFNPIDVNDMAAATLKYLNLDKKQKNIFGDNSRVIAEELFNENDFVNKYINLMS